MQAGRRRDLRRGLGGDGKDWEETVVKVGNGSEGFDVSPDGREVWVANAQDGTISVIDFAGRKVVATLMANVPGANRLKFTPDGKRVLVGTQEGGGGARRGDAGGGEAGDAGAGGERDTDGAEWGEGFCCLQPGWVGGGGGSEDVDYGGEDRCGWGAGWNGVGREVNY